MARSWRKRLEKRPPRARTSLRCPAPFAQGWRLRPLASVLAYCGSKAASETKGMRVTSTVKGLVAGLVVAGACAWPRRLRRARLARCAARQGIAAQRSRPKPPARSRAPPPRPNRTRTSSSIRCCAKPISNHSSESGLQARMHHFHYKDGVLHAEDVSLAQLAAEVGTPFYCYATATLKRHYRVLQRSLRRPWTRSSATP